MKFFLRSIRVRIAPELWSPDKPFAGGGYMFSEFKKFINQANVLELAVAFIMATAFAAVIKSLVDNIIMPPIGLLFGGTNVTNLYINLSNKSYASFDDALKAGAPVIGYGIFINTIITFLIVALVMFFIIRAYNAARPKPVDTKECPYCLSTIPENATRCPNCTSQLGAAAAST
jgi:large conductance mechanosensitive channel